MMNESTKSKWMPISEAPRDGECVLVCMRLFGLHAIAIARWVDGREPGWHSTILTNDGLEDGQRCNPTHWQPLPEPVEKGCV